MPASVPEPSTLATFLPFAPFGVGGDGVSAPEPGFLQISNCTYRRGLASLTSFETIGHVRFDIKGGSHGAPGGYDHAGLLLVAVGAGPAVSPGPSFSRAWPAAPHRTRGLRRQDLRSVCCSPV